MWMGSTVRLSVVGLYGKKVWEVSFMTERLFFYEMVRGNGSWLSFTGVYVCMRSYYEGRRSLWQGVV